MYSKQNQIDKDADIEGKPLKIEHDETETKDGAVDVLLRQVNATIQRDD
jgi:hypothetical protein